MARHPKNPRVEKTPVERFRLETTARGGYASQTTAELVDTVSNLMQILFDKQIIKERDWEDLKAASPTDSANP